MGCVQVGLLLLCVVVTCADHCGFGQRDCGPCSCTGRQTCRRKGIPSGCPDESKEWPCYGGTPYCHPWGQWGQWSPPCDCHTTRQSRTRSRRKHVCCTGPSSETETRNCPSRDCNHGDDRCQSRGGRCQPAGDRCIGGYNQVKGLCRYEPCCKCCKGCQWTTWTTWTTWSYGDCSPSCSSTHYGIQTCTRTRSRTKCDEVKIQPQLMTRGCRAPSCGCTCRPWTRWEDDCDPCVCQADGTKKHECRRHREHCDDCHGDDHESRRGSCFSDCDCRGEWMPWVGKCTRERRRGKGTCPGPRVVEERSCSAP